MTTQTIRPNGTNTQNNYVVIGGGTPAGAASDASDATYVRSTDANPIVFDMGTYALATTAGAAERCLRVRGKVRGSSQDGTSGAAQVAAWQMGNVGIGGGIGAWWQGDAALFGLLAEHDGTLFNDANGSEWTQAALNGIQVQFFSYTIGGFSCRLYDFWLDLDIRTQPTQTIAALGTVTVTHSPTLAWTQVIHDSQAQIAYQIRVFDKSINATPAWTDTSGLAWDSAVTPSAAAARRLPSFANSNYRAFVSVAKDFNGAKWWSTPTSIDFTMNCTPGVPTLVTPAAASTQNTNLPVVTCKLPTPPTDSPTLAPNKVMAQWQLAADAGFTTSLETVTDATWYTVTHGAISGVPTATPLTIGTWYVRARALDFYGAVSSWSSAQAFTIAHPPSSTVVTPSGAQIITYDPAGNTFDWGFYSTSPDEEQTAYEVVIEDNGDGTLLVDTGKITSAIPEAAIVVPATSKDQTLRWKVKVWDADDVASVYSGYAIFQASDSPNVVVTVTPDPSTSPQPAISWVMTGSSGRTQVAYRVALLTASGSTAYDTGKVNDPTTDSWQPPDASTLMNLSSYSVMVFVWDNYGLTGNDTDDFTTMWTVPAAPDFVVDTDTIDTNGYVGINWTDASIDPAWVSWRVYRRETTVTSSWTLLAEDFSGLSSHQYRDSLVKANVSYDYVVAQVVTEFASEVESVYAPATVMADASHYWLIDPNDLGLSVKLPLVKSDDFTEEYETSELLLVGRGRKVDFGDRWGYRGTMVAQLRDDTVTASDMKLAIQAAKNDRSALYLRTPFGELWQVVVGDIAFSRVDGSGIAEWLDVTIPYIEVA